MATSGKVQVWNRALYRIGSTEKVETETDDSPEAMVCADCYDDVVKEVLEAFVWAFATKQAPLGDIGEQTATYVVGDVADDQTFTCPTPFSASSEVAVTKDGVDLVEGTDYTVTAPDPDVPHNGYVYLTAAITGAESITITVTQSRIGWENVYSLPSDCVRPLSLMTTDGARIFAMPVSSKPAFAIQSSTSGMSQWLLTDLEQDDDFDSLEYVCNSVDVSAWPRQFLDAVVWRLASELADALKKSPEDSRRCMGEYIRAMDWAKANQGNTGHDLEPTTPSLAARQ